jgi:DNA-damage-inducible protein D
MTNELSKQEHSLFEQIRKVDDNGNEYWSARDLAKAFEYVEFRNFKPVIEKAEEACKNSGHLVENHFVEYHEMVKISSGAERGFNDGVKLLAMLVI